MRTKRSFPFFISCLIGLSSSSFEIYPPIDQPGSTMLAVNVGLSVMASKGCSCSRKGFTDFKLAIGPSRDLNNHVQYRLLLVCIQRDIVESRDGDSIPLDEDAVLQSVGRANLSDAVTRHIDFAGRVRYARAEVLGNLLYARDGNISFVGARRSFSGGSQCA